MDTLPSEVLLKIFTHLSQRYIVIICSTVCKKWNEVINQPWLFSTFHIYSTQQLKRVIQLAKEGKTINNKHIGHYVKCLKFYYIPFVKDTRDLFVFPNLQHIDGIHTNHYTAGNNYAIYLHVNQPTDYIYWYTNEIMITIFNKIKYNLKSLNIYMNKELIGYIPQQQQQLETIHMKSIGSVIENRNNEPNLIIPIKLLILPTTSLKNLIKLNIDFICLINSDESNSPYYIIDERTFENIHQSCPLLESLSAEGFNMDISDEFLNNNEIIPAHRLKMINIYSIIHHQHCFQYLTTKYPHLESLSLLLKFKNLSSEEIKPFQDAILNMLLHLPFLKKFIYNHQYYIDKVWPYYEIFKWLNQESNPLTFLKYDFPLTAIKSIKMNDFNNTDINNNDILLLQQLQQFNFLNHLTRLSLGIDNAIDLVFTFLSENKNTTIVSTTLKELEIDQFNHGGAKYMYIYDWLNMFPNLLLFKLWNTGHITDDRSLISNCHNHYRDDKWNDDIFYKLHHLFKERKQQHDILNKRNGDHSSYKLEYLIISLGRIWLKNGFNDLLKKCRQLKKLELNNVDFINPMESPNEIHLDLSHLHLELLNIINISFVPLNNIKISNKITKLIIHETLTDCKRIIESGVYKYDNRQFSLKLESKFIDGLAFRFF